MLEVILLRHAAAQMEQYGKNDRDRTISMAGMHEIEAIRPKLTKTLQGVSFVSCSNVKRTRQTLEGIRQFIPNTAEIHFDDSLYQASAEVLLHKVQTTSPVHKKIMFIGHNPCLTSFVININSEAVTTVATCCTIVLRAKVSKWHEVSYRNFSIQEILNNHLDN